MGRLPARAETVRWGEFAFVPAHSVRGYDTHTIVRMTADEIEAWPLKVILANLAGAAAEHLLATVEKRDYPTYDELSQWADLTASMASRLPYAGGLRDEMLQIADHALRFQNQWQHFSESGPRGRIEESEYRFSWIVWAMDELRRAARVPPVAFWEGGMQAFLDAFPVSVSDNTLGPDALRKRASRFAKNLKSDAAESAMRYILRDITCYGVLLADGSRNPRGPNDRQPKGRSGPNIH